MYKMVPAVYVVDITKNAHFGYWVTLSTFGKPYSWEKVGVSGFVMHSPLAPYGGSFLHRVSISPESVLYCHYGYTREESLVNRLCGV
mgnify:CR=1 FL=1